MKSDKKDDEIASLKKRIVQLEEQNQQLDEVISLIPGHVYWKNKEGLLLGCNDEQAKDVGLKSRHEIKGLKPIDLIRKNQPETARIRQAKAIEAADKKVLQSGLPISIEETAVLNNGAIGYFISNKVPLHDKEGLVTGLVGISIDITDRKKMEQDLTLAKEKAEAANYLMTEFISNMGHTLVTPFSTITGVATMLLYGFSDKYLELKPHFEELMQGCGDWEKAYRQIIQATSLVEMEIKLESFSINQELLTIGSIMEPSIGSKPLTLTIKPFKPQNQDLIETDKLKFHLILIELISNAIKFTEKGNITVSATKKKGLLTIKVADTGIGIPSDKLDYVFKQYTMLSRAQKHGANFKGVGAGLFLAKQRAKLLNATLTLESEVGKGSTFSLSIPTQNAFID